MVGLVDLGAEREVTAEVYLGSLSPDDVAVELLHGPVVAADELADAKIVRLERDGSGAPTPAGVCAIRVGSVPTRPAGMATPCGWCRPTATFWSRWSWAA